MAVDAAVASTMLKDLPIITSPITSEGWRSHLKRINLFFMLKGVTEDAANNALKRTLLFYSLGNAGGIKAYHLSPDVRPAAETYANYLAELGKIFVPPQESDMARSDYRKCKQSKNEPLQTFHNKKTRLWYDAYQITAANLASHMDSYLEEYLGSIVRREVKLDLIEHKPYARPEDVLSRALTSAAKHRMLIPESAPVAAYDGLHSTNQSVVSSGGATSTGARAAAPAGVEPMELGLLYQGGEEEQEFAALMTQESAGETGFWEDPDTQIFGAIDQGGRQTSLCWSCHRPGHTKRDCWRRPRNEALMNQARRGGGRGNYRGRGGYGRGGGQQRGGGTPSAAYQRTVEIAQQARGGPQAFSRPPARGGNSHNSYANSLFAIHEEEQPMPIYMLQMEQQQQPGTSESSQTPAPAATAAPPTAAANRPTFNGNF